MANISHFTQTVNGVSTTYDIHDANAVPRSGTNSLSGSIIPSTDNAYTLGDSTHGFTNIYVKYVQGSNTQKELSLFSSDNTYDPWNHGASVSLYTNDYSGVSDRIGTFSLRAQGLGDNYCNLTGTPNGTLTWNGQAIQTVSDQRYKQQIAEIDDKLLDAWEDVEPSQFKYNDAVSEKGKDKARLHTGYVVQQIDSACKSHGVDISTYGLYCHEEYPQETEEVEVENEDGTKTKEKKVIREASEHYSLRYTEVYAVECMYLRRCIARLTARIEELEKGNNTK